MLRDDKIQDQLFGSGVGWKQPTTSGYDIVDDDNLGDVSGLKFQDASFMVTIKNIKDSQEDIAITDEEFNELLAGMQRTVISDVCNKVTFRESDNIQSVNLYPFEKAFSDTLDTSGRFIGFKIKPSYLLDKLAIVTQLELAFDTAKTFKVYLFNSNVKEAINSQGVTTVSGQSVIQNVQWYIADNTTYKGGVFYLGYFEDDLSGAKPYKRNYGSSNIRYETPYFDVYPVSIQHSNNVLDVSSYKNLTDTGGLSLTINIYNDYTELVVRNKNKFAYAIQQEMAVRVLDLVRNSTRTNATDRSTDRNVQNINMELHGFKDETVYVQGLISKVNRAIADLRKHLFYQPRISKTTLR